ncbi:hypothetical protein KY342_00520, partial [Candidatus Woesearchaeota archaeon]|nr:hypothetical protein [Candidatus Woesearchaeota archaeon]
LTAKQITAIKKMLELGKELQSRNDAWEMVEDARRRMFFLDIALKYGISSSYGVTEEIAANSVGRMLRGYEKGYFVEPYDGLIEPGELEEIIQQHHSKSSSHVGLKIYEEGKGIFDLSEDERLEACKKGGRTSGKNRATEGSGVCGLTYEERCAIGIRSYEQGKGIHAMTFEAMSKRSKRNYSDGVGIGGMTTEQRKKIGKKSGLQHVRNGTGWFGMSEEEIKEARKKAVIALGYKPWTEEELKTVYLLSQDSSYQRGTQANLALIADKVNDTFHDGGKIRTNKAISNALSRYKVALSQEDKNET